MDRGCDGALAEQQPAQRSADDLDEDLGHFQLDPAAARGYASLADLHVAVGGARFPCHSGVLAGQCRVLRDMFASTCREEWAVGLGVAVEGHSAADVRLFLALVYDRSSVRRTRAQLRSEANLLGALALADKLHAADVAAVCQRVLIEERAGGEHFKVEWLGIAGDCGFEDLHRACAAEVLQSLLTTPAARLDDIGCTGAAGWAALSRADYKLLLQGMLRAWQTAQRKQLYQAVDSPVIRRLHAEDQAAMHVTLREANRLDGRKRGRLARRAVERHGGGNEEFRPLPASSTSSSIPVDTSLAFRLHHAQLLACLD